MFQSSNPVVNQIVGVFVNLFIESAAAICRPSLLNGLFMLAKAGPGSGKFKRLAPLATGHKLAQYFNLLFHSGMIALCGLNVQPFAVKRVG